MNKHVGSLLVLAAVVAAPSVTLAAPPAGERVVPAAAAPAAQKGMINVKLSVNGMVCHDCAGKVRKVAMGLPGVKDCMVMQKLNEAVVTYDPKKVKVEEIVKKLSAAGYRASIKKA